MEITIIIAIATAFGLVLLFLVFRNVLLWYYKIDKIVDLLEDIKYALTSSKPKTIPTWECPKCKTVNSNYVYACAECGYSLT